MNEKIEFDEAMKVVPPEEQLAVKVDELEKRIDETQETIMELIEKINKNNENLMDAVTRIGAHVGLEIEWNEK